MSRQKKLDSKWRDKDNKKYDYIAFFIFFIVVNKLKCLEPEKRVNRCVKVRSVNNGMRMWRLYIFSFFVIVASFSKAILYIIQNNFSKIGWQVVKTLCLSGLQPVLRLTKVDMRLTRSHSSFLPQHHIFGCWLLLFHTLYVSLSDTCTACSRVCFSRTYSRHNRAQTWLYPFGLTRTFLFNPYYDQYRKWEQIRQNSRENLIL